MQVKFLFWITLIQNNRLPPRLKSWGFLHGNMVNVMQHFCVSGSDAFGGYIAYIDRNEATRNEKTIKYNLYNDYMGNPEKTTGLFTKNEDRLSKDEKREIKEKFVNAQRHGSIMWQTVISFDNRWLEKQGLCEQKGDIITLDENKIQEVVRYGVTKMLHSENLDHAVWSAAIHSGIYKR